MLRSIGAILSLGTVFLDTLPWHTSWRGKHWQCSSNALQWCKSALHLTPTFCISIFVWATRTNIKCTIQTSKGLVQNSAFRRFVMMQEVLQCYSSQLDNLMSATTKILQHSFTALAPSKRWMQKLQLFAIDTTVCTTCQDNARFKYAFQQLQIGGVGNNGKGWLHQNLRFDKSVQFSPICVETMRQISFKWNMKQWAASRPPLPRAAADSLSIKATA